MKESIDYGNICLNTANINLSATSSSIFVVDLTPLMTLYGLNAKSTLNFRPARYIYSHAHGLC